jgi:hypothetical protein
MRTPSLTICALLLLCLCLVGCGSSLEQGPTTQVEIMHIRATLPGTDWSRVSSGKLGPLDTERWESDDGLFFFRVSSNPDEQLDYPIVGSEQIDEYLDLMDFPPSTEVESSMLMGRNAVRIEGVSPSDDGFRTVDYVIIAGLRHFYVGAGAANSIWESGGADVVFDILNNAKVAIVK